MNLDPLSEIAARCGGDKFGAHVYTPIYHDLFRHLRNLPIKLLELGIGGYGDELAGGSSLLTWSEYFPNGTIVGLDISKKCIDRPNNVKIIQGAQDDFDLLKSLTTAHGPFDIVIDDASHNNALTQKSFLHLYPTMASEGIYVVEDTQTAFATGSGGRVDGHETMFHVANAISLAMHQKEGYWPNYSSRPFEQSTRHSFPDIDVILNKLGTITRSVAVFRNMIAFHRGDNTYPSNQSFSFNHPDVKKIYDAMTEMAELSPSSRDSLARIDMNIWANRFSEAAILALSAAERYPENLMLLHELRYLMRWAKRPVEVELLDRRIAAFTKPD